MLMASVCSWPWNFHWPLVIHQWGSVSCMPNLTVCLKDLTPHSSLAIPSHPHPQKLYIHWNKLLSVPLKQYILLPLHHPHPPHTTNKNTLFPKNSPFPATPTQPFSLPSFLKPGGSALSMFPQHGTYHTRCLSLHSLDWGQRLCLLAYFCTRGAW